MAYEFKFIISRKEMIPVGRFFSDRVETALKYIYYDMGAGRGQEGFQLLQQAV